MYKYIATLKIYHKKILFAFLLLFLFSANFAFALEVTYPNIPFLPRIDKNSQLPAFISYFFGLAIYLSGILAVISFAIGAIQLIMSAENPENASNAKDRMKGSVLGLVLTLSAFIILRTINPVLITPSLTPLGEVPGVFYANIEAGETKPAPIEEADIANVPEGYNTIVYKCAANSYSPTLLIWTFPNINFQGNDANYSGAQVQRLGCEGQLGIAGFGSFRMAFQTPGIYYCLGGCTGDWCSGFMSGANVASGQLSEPFKNNVKSIVIVNDISSSIRYGVIFHGVNDPTRGGSCSHPLLPYENNNISFDMFCQDYELPDVSSSADIFVWNTRVETSGNGIDFYSKPWGWNTGANAGKYAIDKTLGGYSNWFDDASKLVFDYTGVNEQDAYKKSCKNFKECPGSIRIKGNYLVALHSDAAKNPYCQTFYKDVPNINETEFTAVNNKIDVINVIPIK